MERIFGEIEILLEHIKLQNNTFAGIEGVNKNKVETLEESCDNVMAELMRRSEVLESTIQKKMKTYIALQQIIGVLKNVSGLYFTMTIELVHVRFSIKCVIDYNHGDRLCVKI